MQTLISIDLKADFGFFRKPDTNAGINLSYNMLHKPALLGILGAIIGLEGYKAYGKLPEYYEKLQDIKIGVEPLEGYHEKGNFAKTVIKYSNTVGYANKGANYLTEEATLIKPAYRCYILLDINDEDQQKLYTYLKEGKAEYLPYFGKNEFSAWWEKESFEEYEFEKNISEQKSFKVKSIFKKNREALKGQKEEPMFDLINIDSHTNPYVYFERLPEGFDTTFNQYALSGFAFTTFKILSETDTEHLYFLKSKNYHVQLL